MTNQSHLARKWAGLKWKSPSPWLPHGLSGCVTLVLGAKHTLDALRGDLGGSPILIIVYLTAAAINALSGLRLSHLASKSMQTMFQLASMLQISLVWFAARFYMSASAASLPNNRISETLRTADQAFASSIVVGIISFAWITMRKVTELYGQVVAVSVMAGCLCLTLLSGYPLQLAFGDSTWYSCIMSKYPQQRTGFVQYVYIPATFSFAAMMFGATLLNRKIISRTVFGSFFVVLILATLFATVLMQEIHIPVVSTQKLIIICPDPGMDQPISILQVLSETLDTSRLAQHVLTGLGVTTPTQPTCT